ncbi:MAG: hypothetical protein JOS17DRAFT_776386 [Linnemannia elongata]|nr:MAG: hypothetical protein JOS17DRAFT_776386 [Linnemannia elongata]
MVHSVLEKMLSSLGDKHRLVFYIDGGAALEEKDAHQQRRQKRGKAGKEAGTALDTLQSRIHNNKRLTRQHFLRANKSINAAFYWATEDRVSFAEYLTERTYHVVMCDTEADTRIAADCRDVDVILSRDSDYMGYRSVRTIWRPVGGWNINKCLVYSKDDILASLEFTDVQLIALACVTKNDYEPNIRGLALVSNFGIMKDLGSRDDVQTLIRDYLQHPKVLKQNTDNQTFSNSIKAFVQCRQDRAPDTAPSSGPSYKDLRQRFQQVTYQYQERKNRAGSATSDKEWTPRHNRSQQYNRYRIIDKPPPDRPNAQGHHRPRYFVKKRPEPKQKDSQPVVKQYQLKPYTPEQESHSKEFQKG